MKQSFESKLYKEIQKTAAAYIMWRDSLKTEYRGEQLMYDVPTHYRWLTETELFVYYMDFFRYEK